MWTSTRRRRCDNRPVDGNPVLIKFVGYFRIIKGVQAVTDLGEISGHFMAKILTM
jgi:hypothetical protein